MHITNDLIFPFFVTNNIRHIAKRQYKSNLLNFYKLLVCDLQISRYTWTKQKRVLFETSFCIQSASTVCHP